MFSESQLEPLVSEMSNVAEKRGLIPERAALVSASIDIGREVWGFAKHQYWSDGVFLSIEDDEGRSDSVSRLQKAADTLDEALRELAGLHPDAEDLLRSIFFGFPKYKNATKDGSLIFGGAARPQDVHRLKEVKDAAVVMAELAARLPEEVREVFSTRQVPRRENVKYIEDIVSPQVSATHLFRSEAVYFSVCLRGAAAVCRRRRGGQPKRGALMLARCALVWRDATGVLPVQTLRARKASAARETREPATPFYHEVIRLLRAAGGAIDGLSTDTFINVMKRVGTEEGTFDARWNFEVRLSPKKKKSQKS